MLRKATKKVAKAKLDTAISKIRKSANSLTPAKAKNGLADPRIKMAQDDAKAAAKAVLSKATTREASSGLPEKLRGWIEQLFDATDSNKNGSVQFSEFLLLHKSLLTCCADVMEPERHGAILKLESDQMAEANFHEYDVDHNLRWDKDEFYKYMESMNSIVGTRLFTEICERMVQREISRNTSDLTSNVQSGLFLEKTKCITNFAEFHDIVRDFLVDKNADPNFCDAAGGHALFHAADRADESAVQLLLHSRADPDAHTKAMECAAFRAAQARNLDVLRILLLPERREYFSAVEKQVGISNSMSCISSSGTAETSTAATEAMAAVCIKSSQDLVRGMNSHTSCEVKEFLSKKANPSYKDRTGWTPLTAASFWGKTDCTETLLRTQRTLGGVKLRIDGRNHRGRSPLHVAARKGKADIINLLIGAHAQFDLQDTDGWTALHHAAFNARDDAVKALIAAGATPDIRGRNGFTPLIASSLSSRAGNLGQEATKLLEVSEKVAFGKHVAPILHKDDLNIHEKLQALLTLPGVQYNYNNLRLYEQFFPSTAGPSKMRLHICWECLALPLLRRLRSGETDLDPPGPHLSDSVKQERIREIEHRWKEQKRFVQHWLQDTAGPRPSTEWPHQNRGAYAAELQQLLSEELAGFEKELAVLYARTKEQPGGSKLMQMPAEETLKERYCSQLQAHPIPVWLEQPSASGAFEALRLVGCGNMGKDDDEAVMSFMEFVSLNPGLDTGKGFWKNVYREWLAHYAQAVDAEFQRCIKLVVDRFNTAYKGQGKVATYTAAKPKQAERIRAKERRFDDGSWETYEGRTVAAKVLDVVRGSICVKSPDAANILVEEFFRPATMIDNKFEVVRIRNGFNENAETLLGYRYLEINIHWQGGIRVGECGRPHTSLQHAIVGEVQIVLEDYLAVRKRRHIIYKCSTGVFDWPPEDKNVDRTSSMDISDDEGNMLSTDVAPGAAQ
jgi:ankyrin repeat protein